MSQKKIKQAKRHIRAWARQHKQNVENKEPGLYINELGPYDSKLVRKILREEWK